MGKENKQKTSDWKAVFWAFAFLGYLFLYSFIFLMAIYGVLDFNSSFKLALLIMMVYGFSVFMVTLILIMNYLLSKKSKRKKENG